MGKSFKSSKCAGLLKMTVSRIKLLKNKREIQCKQQKQDIAILLRKGLQDSASFRVEHVFKEQNILDAYFLIEGFCYLVTERMMAIEKQKTCPNDLKEAIASLIFAAPRCADLPELQEVRSIFSTKYGQEFSTAAVELHPDSGVNRQIIEKLSTRPPSTDIKLWLLKEVAAENGVDWDSEKVKDILKATEDLLDGPQHFAGSQIKQNPSDGARQGPESENAKDCIESNKSLSRRNVSQFAFVSQPHSVLPASYPEHMSENEQKTLPVAIQGYSRPPSAKKYDSNKSKGKPVNSANVARIVNSKHFEDNPYNILRKEGKMDYHVHKEVMDCTSGYQQFPSEHDGHQSFTKFTRADENSINLTQDKIKYEDAAMAAEAAFLSAAYAAEAAKAAISLAKCEPYDKSTQSEKNQSEADLDSELDEALEAALARSVHILGSDYEDNISARTGEAFSRKSSRSRKCETNYDSYCGSGSEMVHSTQRIATNLIGEETSKAQISSSRAKKNPPYKYAQQHFKDYNDNADEDKFSTFHKNRKLHVKQEDLKGSEMQSRRLMLFNASSLSSHSSSSKATPPVFDDYDGDECKHIYSGSTRLKSTSNATLITEKNVFSYVSSASDISTTPKFSKHNHYEKSSRRQKEKKHDIFENEMHPDNSRSEMNPGTGKGLEAEGEVKMPKQKAKTRSLKPSFKDFVQQETRSFEDFNLQSDEGTVSLNNFERTKFQYQRKASSLKSSYPDNNEGVYNYSSNREAWQGCGTMEGISKDDQACQSLPKMDRYNSVFEQSVEMPNNYVSSNISKQRILDNSLQSKHDNEWHNEEVDSSIGHRRHDKEIHYGESCKTVRTKQKSRGPQTTRNQEKEKELANVGYATSDDPSHISYKTSSRKKIINGSMSNSSPFVTAPPPPPLFAADIGEIQKQTLNSSINKTCTDEEFSERLAALRRKH